MTRKVIKRSQSASKCHQKSHSKSSASTGNKLNAQNFLFDLLEDRHTKYPKEEKLIQLVKEHIPLLNGFLIAVKASEPHQSQSDHCLSYPKSRIGKEISDLENRRSPNQVQISEENDSIFLENRKLPPAKKHFTFMEESFGEESSYLGSNYTGSLKLKNTLEINKVNQSKRKGSIVESIGITSNSGSLE